MAESKAEKIKDTKETKDVSTENGEKQRAIQNALQQIERAYGKGSIMRMDDKVVDKSIAAYSTGSIGLDVALGIGGIPRQRITEIYGMESSGKTTLALEIVAQAQKKGAEVAYVDTEFALDPTYAKNLGVDVQKMYISQPDTAEDAFNIIDTLVRSGGIDLIVLDSVAALCPKAELEGDIGDATVGLVARLMSQALRKLAGAVSKSNCTLIFINQLREKIGVFYGNPYTTTGGKSLAFYSSCRIECKKTETMKNGKDIMGSKTKMRVVKNKVAPPFKECEVDLVYNQGFDIYGELVDMGVIFELVQKGGAWFTYGEERFQGRDNMKAYLKENQAVADELQAKIYEKIREKM